MLFFYNKGITAKYCITCTSMTRQYLTDFPIIPGVCITDIGSGTPVTYTYYEINQRIDAVAHGLLSLELETNSKIAILGTCSYNFVTTNIGIYRSRHAVVPINYKVPKTQIEFCIRDSGAVLAFCDIEFRELVPKDIKCIVFGSTEFEEFLNYKPCAMPELDENSINNIMYTSGTTGKPKGVVSTYRNRLWQISRGRVVPTQKPGMCITVNPAPLYHLAGLNNIEQDLFYSYFTDTHIVLMPQFNARQYIQQVEHYRATHVKLIAPMMSMVLQETDLLDKTNLDSVNYVILTSSAAPKKLQDDLRVYFQKVHTVENPYGLTETGPLFGPHPLKIPKPVLSVGYPIKGVQARIGYDGVLQVKSPSIMAGYHNRPELYVNSMTVDGYFITGDLFRVNKHGFYFYIGRADDMFKSGGEKIYPSEIESVIDSHPAVAISTIVGIPDEIKGHKPYAFVQLKAGQHATNEEIKEFAVKNVATYQIPRRVWILDELPKTNIGKIDRQQLIKQAQELLNNDIQTTR